MTQTSVYYISPNDNREVVCWINGELGMVEGYPFDPLNISEFIDRLIFTENMDYNTQCIPESIKVINFVKDYINERTKQYNLEKQRAMKQKRDAKKDLEVLDKSCGTAVFSISEYWIKEAEAQRIRADKTEQERDKLIQVLKDIVAVPVAKSMHNEALILHNIAHKALEGSNTDAKRD